MLEYIEAVNAFCLMLLLFPTLLLMGLQFKIEKDLRILNLGQRSIGIIGLALTAWVNDRYNLSIINQAFFSLEYLDSSVPTGLV